MKAKKSFGQHFLKDEQTLKDMVEAADIRSGETIIEIGPGKGALTDLLVKVTSKLILIERDPELIPLLKERYGELSHVEIIHADIMKYSLSSNMRAYKVVANIPYYITSDIIEKFLLHTMPRPQSLVLLVQKEFAEKACSTPPRSTFLSNYLQLLTEPSIEALVPNHYFVPPPKVDSAILKLKVKENIDNSYVQKALPLMKKAFAKGRKKLSNTLTAPSQTTLAELYTKRPEVLTQEEWKEMITEY